MNRNKAASCASDASVTAVCTEPDGDGGTLFVAVLLGDSALDIGETALVALGDGKEYSAWRSLGVDGFNEETGDNGSVLCSVEEDFAMADVSCEAMSVGAASGDSAELRGFDDPPNKLCLLLVG